MATAVGGMGMVEAMEEVAGAIMAFVTNRRFGLTEVLRNEN